MRFSPKTGRVRKRPARPRLGLTERLANLHLLLRSSSFERWPLRVTFYAEDVHRVWLRWLNQHPELTGNGGLREGLRVTLDNSTKPAESAEGDAPTGIRAIDVTYAPLKDNLAKSRTLLAEPDQRNCTLCSTALSTSGASTLVCPNTDCHATTHITCLSAHFLSASPSETLLPTIGQCPSCEAPLEWQDLVKELSLRMRGEKEVETLFKPPRTRKTKGKAAAAISDGSEDELPGDALLDDHDGEDEDEWHRLPDTSDVEMEDDELPVARSDPSPPLRGRKANHSARAGAARSEPVVEDSDWEEAEIIA